MEMIMKYCSLPAAILLIALFFFLLFRKQIIALINRIKGIKVPGGVSLDLVEQRSTPEVNPRTEAELLMRQFDNVLILQTEENIRADFRQKNLLGVEGIPVLIRYTAALSIAYNFLDIYRIIFGSQIRLLDHLNTQQGQPIEALRVFYDSGASLYPEYSFEQWVGYLRGQSLINDNNGLISITLKGREFLVFVTQLGLNRNKIG